MSLVSMSVRAGAVVYVGERAYGPGETITLPAAEAKALAEQGLADKAPPPARA